MRTAERTASPRWPWLVVPALLAAITVVGTLAWRSAAEAEREAEAVAQERAAQEDRIAAIAAKLNELEDEQSRLQHEREQLELQLEMASTAAERDALLAKQAELDAKIVANGGTKPATKPSGKKPTKPTTKPKPDESTKPGRPPIVIDDTTDPLAGLGGP
jgi:septal ring factor EnvC (AmiA/AmiB activator)